MANKKEIMEKVKTALVTIRGESVELLEYMRKDGYIHVKVLYEGGLVFTRDLIGLDVLHVHPKDKNQLIFMILIKLDEEA